MSRSINARYYTYTSQRRKRRAKRIDKKENEKVQMLRSTYQGLKWTTTGTGPARLEYIRNKKENKREQTFQSSHLQSQAAQTLTRPPHLVPVPTCHLPLPALFPKVQFAQCTLQTPLQTYTTVLLYAAHHSTLLSSFSSESSHFGISSSSSPSSPQPLYPPPVKHIRQSTSLLHSRRRLSRQPHLPPPLLLSGFPRHHTLPLPSTPAFGSGIFVSHHRRRRADVAAAAVEAHVDVHVSPSHPKCGRRSGRRRRSPDKRQSALSASVVRFQVRVVRCEDEFRRRLLASVGRLRWPFGGTGCRRRQQC